MPSLLNHVKVGFAASSFVQFILIVVPDKTKPSCDDVILGSLKAKKQNTDSSKQLSEAVIRRCSSKYVF